MYRFPWWWIPIVVIVVVVPLGVWQFVTLSPQTTVCLASGREGGAYSQFAQEYLAALRDEGFSVADDEEKNECKTAGSVRNLELLVDPTKRSDSENDCHCNPNVALVQAGVASAEFEKEPEDLRTLMSTFHELVWVFYRTDVNGGSSISKENVPSPGPQTKQWAPSDPIDLAGRRIGIGEVKSGTRSLAMLMLREVGLHPGQQDNEVDQQDIEFVSCEANKESESWEGKTRLVGCNNDKAARQLEDGILDAAFFVVHPGAPFLKKILVHNYIDFMSFRRAEAYASLFPYLVVVSLPGGVLDMVRNTPKREKTVLAVPANLVGSAKLSDDLVRGLIRTITRTNEKARKRNPRFAVFPWGTDDAVPTYSDLPVSDAARDWFDLGDSWLERQFNERYVDAIYLKRILTVAPFILIFGFALAAIFPLRRRAIHGHFYRWYTVLREVEGEIESLRDEPSIEAQVRRIKDLERETASKARIPDWGLGGLYDLRVHIRLVLSRLEEQRVKMSGSARTE